MQLTAHWLFRQMIPMCWTKATCPHHVSCGKETNKGRRELDESNQCIKTLGKLWWIALTHSADDDENVVQDEYDRAWAQFQVSRSKF